MKSIYGQQHMESDIVETACKIAENKCSYYLLVEEQFVDKNPDSAKLYKKHSKELKKAIKIFKKHYNITTQQ